ncbi:MAG: hypothetical protein ABIK99_05180 [candidate division WOR-3 bacterium]
MKDFLGIFLDAILDDFFWIVVSGLGFVAFLLFVFHFLTNSG